MNIGDEPIKFWQWSDIRGMYVDVAVYQQWIAVRNDAHELTAVIVPGNINRSQTYVPNSFIGTNNVRHRVYSILPETEGLCRIELGPCREVMN